MNLSGGWVDEPEGKAGGGKLEWRCCKLPGCKALFRSIVFERPFGQNRTFNAGVYFETFDAT